MGIFSFIFDVFSAIRSFFTYAFSRNKTKRLEYSNNFYQNNNKSSCDRDLKYHAFSEKTRCKESFRSYVAPDRTCEWLEMETLDLFPMPHKILDFERNVNDPTNEITELMSQKANFRLSEDLYIKAYKTMTFFEEAAETITTEAFNLTDVTINEIAWNKRIEFYFDAKPRSDELFTAIDDKRLYYFTLKSKSNETKIYGKLNRRVSEKIFVVIFKKNFEADDNTYDVLFNVNRLNLQLQHNALWFVEMHRLFPILINNPLYHDKSQSSQLSRATSFDHHSQSSITNQDDLNAEQMQAIHCIVNGTYHPVPYLLYGPPGTGKTKTVVAAIEKIVRTTNENILICAQSNAACNEIAERLAKLLTPTEMLRMFSKSNDLDEISSTIKPFCNLFDDELQYPALNYLYTFRVLICTLSTSGCLARAVCSSNFNARHFGFVFIDECASALETMSLIPIAGICTSVDTVHAKIVLIGDPKQLDAVTKSTWSTELGFKTSWFEQLFNVALYKRDTITGKFNQNYITQLVRNYRSHRAILEVPNELFYDYALVSAVTPDLVPLEVDGLLRKAFPIIFKSVHGYCKKDNDSPSSYNMEEVKTVLEFIDELLKPEKYQLNQFDIGIVSPYKLQCTILRRLCANKGLENITIGSAETFQGQERKVMIMSTVRSGDWRLGDFLKNTQRMNVMITRAKSLLIVVGNPHLLSQDENWAAFIRYCFENKCLIQDKKYFRLQ